MRRGISRVLVLVAAVFLVSAGYVVYRFLSQVPTASQNETGSPSPSPAADLNTSGWQEYTSPQGEFSLRYPSDLTVEPVADGSVRFFKFGPTQQLETEFYDGISISIRPDNLKEESLEKLAIARYDETAKDPIIDFITEPQPITIGEHKGYSFNVTGLGTWKQIYLPSTPGRYLEIFDSTVDPENQGFAGIVTAMLSSLRFGSR